MKKIALATDDDNPIEQAKTYLTTMFGHIEHGYVTFHGLDADGNWRPDIHMADLAEPNSLVHAATRCVDLSAQGMNVYVATSVMGVTSGRSEENATFTPALIAEFDRITSSENKENAWETLQEVENFLDGLGVPASMIVESGNGWHGYWLLDEPLDWTEFDDLGDRTIAKRTLARFLSWMRSEAPHDMDSVADGARVFRVPGTVNRKYGETKPVTIEKLNPAARYSAREIADEIIPVDIAVTHSFTGGAVDIQLSDIDAWMGDSVSVPTARGAEILTEALGRMRSHSDRHPSMRDAVSYLVQDSHRSDVNMGQALKAMSDRFDEIKPETDQVPPKRKNSAGNVIAGEFMDTAKWVISLRIAEQRAHLAEMTATSNTIRDSIPVDETLPEVIDEPVTRVSTSTDPVVVDARVADLAANYQMQAAAREIATKNINEARFERDWTVPEFVPMQEFVLTDYEPVSYRVDGLWSTESKVLVSAEAKAGKTTLMLNLLNAMTDGGKFLDRFDVTQPDGKIAYVNFEVSARQMHEWVSRGTSRQLDKAFIVNEIGGAGRWDVRVERNREALGALFEQHGITVLVIDTLGMILDALGIEENSNSEVGEVLSGFDALMTETSIEELAIVHHFGHSGDRARGASKLLGWPDSLWTYHVDADDDDELLTAPRFLDVKGRDVSLRKSEVKFDPLTNAVSMEVGADTPGQARAKRKGVADIDAVVGAVRKGLAEGDDEIRTIGVPRSYVEANSGISKNRVGDVLDKAASEGRLIESAGGSNGRTRLFKIGFKGREVEDSIPHSLHSLTTPSPLPPIDEGVVEGSPNHHPLSPLQGDEGLIGVDDSFGGVPSEATEKGGSGPTPEKSEVTEAMTAAATEATKQAMTEMPMGDVEQETRPHECPTCKSVLFEVAGKMICGECS